MFNTNVSYHGRIIARPNISPDENPAQKDYSIELIESIVRKSSVIKEILNDKTASKFSKIDRISKLNNDGVITYQEFITIKYEIL